MIKIKKIFFLVLFLLINIEKVNAEIKDALFMTIGNKPITQSDIVDEIKIILILNNESYSDEKRDQLHELAVRATVKRTIKNIELERYNFFKFNEEDLQKELARLAGNLFIDVNTLKNLCESNGLDFSKIEDQVKTELYWNSLIFSARFKVSSIYSVEPFLYVFKSSISSRTTLIYSGFRMKISLFLFSKFSSYS